MKNITKIVAPILILGLFLYGVTHFSFDEKIQEPILRKEVIKVHNGYGYQIFSGEKLLVQQEFIPAVRGNQPFQSAKDARKVANLVIKKIQDRTSPQVSVDELKELEIVFSGQ
ncbi:DUF4907 domain-containing protein [Flagellimonas pelagia]|uniref:DUF4907 domain-containing protein n=1 Tax=Flagellimonas pelagia TaxID=2306998 RepID=A0A3A1NRI1_9FLAO|nr:DUF4907 domain-containing protein [Allomuricauda maritima]RIV46737.1 DUF4907 domain-containing protein [Allomuricauda maritima]TXJ99622.1 DUF4907 domain-containing protein [Allomuricauda maritima]